MARKYHPISFFFLKKNQIKCVALVGLFTCNTQADVCVCVCVCVFVCVCVCAGESMCASVGVYVCAIHPLMSSKGGICVCVCVCVYVCVHICV